MKTYKNKTTNNLELWVKVIVKRDNSGINDQDRDKREDPAKSPTKELYLYLSLESKNFIKDF